MKYTPPLFTLYRIALLLLAGLAACTVEPIAPAKPMGSPKPIAKVGPLAPHVALKKALGHLGQATSISLQARQKVRPGHIPSAWGLIDTTQVLTVHSPSGKPHYTFSLQGYELGQSGFNTLLLYPAGSGFTGLVFHYVPQAGWQQNQLFSGQLMVYSLQGRVVASLVLQNGQPVGPGSAAGARLFDGTSCLEDINWHQDCSEGEVSTATGVALPQELQHCMWVLELDFSHTCNASSVGAPGTATGSPPGSATPSGGGGSGAAGTPIIIEEPPTQEPAEPIYTGPVIDLAALAFEQFLEQIDDTELDECIKTVLDDLKTLKSDLADILNMFEQNNTYYNWKLKSAPAVDGDVLAVTGCDASPNCRLAITTVFTDNLKGGSDLGIAITLLHELVHAYLRVQYFNEYGEFKQSYPDYINEYFKTENWNQAQHNEFTRSFIEKLGEALIAYGKIKGYDLSEYYYKKLAWSGLFSTDAFKELDPLMRIDIANISLSETSGFDSYGFVKPFKGSSTNCY